MLTLEQCDEARPQCSGCKRRDLECEYLEPAKRSSPNKKRTNLGPLPSPPTTPCSSTSENIPAADLTRHYLTETIASLAHSQAYHRVE